MPEIEAWFINYVCFLSGHGLLSGYSRTPIVLLMLNYMSLQ